MLPLLSSDICAEKLHKQKNKNEKNKKNNDPAIAFLLPAHETRSEALRDLFIYVYTDSLEFIVGFKTINFNVWRSY